MAENLVKFVYGTQAEFDAATKDANTIYFITESTTGDTLHKIYKGDVEYDGTAPSVAAALRTLESYIGDLPVDEDYEDLIDYIEKSDAATATAAQNALNTLDQALADVAKSGAAADVSIADAGNLITAITVEGALQEIATAIDTNETAAKVTMESASGSGDVLTAYDFYQGVAESDDAATKASKKIGTINIPKDYLVKSAEIVAVTTADEPYTGATVGDKYIDFVVNTRGNDGTESHMYIALNDLVAVMQGSVGSEITITIGANNTIQATVNEISGDKIIYSAAVGTAGEEGYKAAVTINDKVAALETALGDGISALHADVDAVTDASVTDSEKVAVVTGITEVAGIITAVDSIDVDKAGAASRAKAAVIGTSSDTYAADTVKGAKAYADKAIGDRIGILDADKDAALAATDTDEYAVAAMSGVTETDGKISAVDSIAVDKAGAATAVKNAVIGEVTDTKDSDTIKGAKKYADSLVGDALTWGTLTSTPSGE